MSADLTQNAVWSSVSRFHDWRAGAFLERLFAAALAAKVIGPPEWMKLQDAEPNPAPPLSAANFREVLLQCAKPADPTEVHVQLGGNRPHPWSSSWTIPAWDAEEQRVTGYAMINLRFPVAAAVPSAPLIEAFTNLYDPGNVEFAFIHPDRDWAFLKMTDYRSPLTYSPMFAGVFWANFLGPGHIEQFDIAALEIPDVAVFRKTESSLLLIVSEDLADALDPAFRERIRALTENFRAVKRRK